MIDREEQPVDRSVPHRTSPGSLPVKEQSPESDLLNHRGREGKPDPHWIKDPPGANP